MGFFQTIGKKIGDVGRSIGKSVTGAVSYVGKQALNVGKGVSSVLGKGLEFVDKSAKMIGGIPIVGDLAKLAMDSPLGTAVKSVYNTAQDVKSGLDSAISIGDKVVKLSDKVNKHLSDAKSDPKKRAELLKDLEDVGKHIKQSKIVKDGHLNKIPHAKKSVDTYNALVKKAQGVLGRSEIEKLKQIIRA